LGDLSIVTRNGVAVPLSQVGRLHVEADEPILWRRNGEAVLSVRADVRDGAQGPT
jgi:multidrug efflux pump subunit AcrB